MYQAYPPQKKGVNHALHIILSICTCGIWIPVWLVWSAIKGGKR